MEKWKCYHDRYATIRIFFVREFLDKVYPGNTAMNGCCKAGTVTTNTRGWYGKFKGWLNKRGIVNLLSIPMLEDAGYIVSIHTKGDWFVTTPKGKKIIFKRDTGVCKGMPYINLRKQKEGIRMIETVRKKFAGGTKREIEKAVYSCTVQRRIGHPPDKIFKEIVSLGENGLRNCPV